MFKRIRGEDFKPLILGQPREKIKSDAIIEAVYDRDGDKKLEQQVIDLEKASGKGMIRLFGYKHHRSMKFFG